MSLLTAAPRLRNTSVFPRPVERSVLRKEYPLSIVAAALKGETDIAVGNVIGSNIFNLLFVLGASVTINPIKTEWISVYDAAILVAVSLFAMIPALQKKEIRRVWGILFILLYAAYTAYLLIR